MIYSREFYSLNLRFAQRVALVTGQPFEQACLHYTNLYVRFGLGRDLNPAHPVWQDYIAGLRDGQDAIEWTFLFARQHKAQTTPDVSQPMFGCFSYSMWDNQRVRLHFHNREEAGVSPLSEERHPIRMSELRAMFVSIQQHEVGVKSVVGGSWLYHLDGYRKLFPLEFLATAKPGKQDYPYMTLWGQFLDRDGQVRQPLAARFIERLERQTTLEGLLDCFPLSVLYLEAPVEVFYPYFGIDNK